MTLKKYSSLTRQQLISEHNTLSFLAWSQYFELFNRKLQLEHALSFSFFFIDSMSKEITNDMIIQLEKSIRNILTTDIQIESIEMKREDLIQLFTQKNMIEKIGIIKALNQKKIDCIKCGEHIDYMLEPHSFDKKRLELFSIHKYLNGFALCFPTQTNPMEVLQWTEPAFLKNMISDYSSFVKTVGIETISDLNNAIINHKIDQLKWAAESYHERKIYEIAGKICGNYEKKKVITIAGPSASNKTTFAKRLQIALSGFGHDSILIEMDDYFVNVEDSPYDEEGNQDWESFDCINTPLLSERVNSLVLGKTVKRRKFDWEKGISLDDPNEELCLKEGGFLIIEGIHGMNPKLIDSLGGKDKVSQIYIQPTSPIRIDHNHRFSCSDYRLIRRLTRDYFFRSFPPRSTIDIWTSVRVGEMNNIFPYQGNADYYFNSALFYEISVINMFAKSLLADSSVPSATEDSNTLNSQFLNNEAQRLSVLTNLFYPYQIEKVPHISCIREFVGGSDLKY
ncbi:hypothetical protein M9Y10_017868 [Tritrichomonas musculus]|uniref:Phosphoribulokinase/uridine kinase domain-containing protein n=1 Tax=Tritrichomonas musculus TaxID=1915356 RepID=A0ABR2GQ39_9EUKA